MADSLTNRAQPDLSKINMHEAHEVKYWSHALGVTKEELVELITHVAFYAGFPASVSALDMAEEVFSER